MENRESENKIPEGVEVLADLGSGILVCKCDVKIIREQDKNARLMKPDMFKQLAENIKNRGTLESLPYCVLTDKIEVVSGHHRLRASKEAGLKEIPILLDVSGLNRSQIAAKQLAHNALNGFDDNNMLKEIAKLITDVDDMIESFIGKDVIGEPLAELEKLLSPIVDFDWKQLQFVFLPHQVKDLELLVKNTAGNLEFIGAAYVDQYKELLNTLEKYQVFKNVKNVGAAIHSMIESANREMDLAGFDEKQEWIPVSKVFGSAAAPAETFEILKKAFDKVMNEEGIDAHNKWKALEILANNYLNK